MRRLICCMTLMLLLFPAMAMAAPESSGLGRELEAFRAEHGTAWEYIPDARGRFLRRLWGQGIQLDLLPDAGPNDVGRACAQLLERWSALLGVQGVELSRPLVRRGLDIWFVRFEQRLGNAPVLGAYIDLRVHASGAVVLVRSELIPNLALAPGQSFRPDSAEAALELAQDELGLNPADSRARLIAWPDRGRGLARWVWRIEQQPGLSERRLAYVDSAEQRILGRRDLLNHAAVSGTVTGLVHELHGNETPVELPLGELRVTLSGLGFDVTDAQGDYSIEAGAGAVTLWAELDGPFADVKLTAAADSRISVATSAGGTVDPQWADANSSAAERDIFYHLGVARAFVKALDAGFVGLDAVLPAVADAAADCDAWWDGAGFYFGAAGAGCGAMGTFADVVYHEYGHAVTEKLGGAADAFPDDMLEAFSDYFACTITGDPQFGEYVLGSATPLRDIDTPDLVTPDDLTGEPEHDGAILAGALWDVRANLIELLGTPGGRELADDLFHFARYGLAQSFEDFFMDVWVLDDDNGDLSDGTPHAYYIVEAFNRHGLGPQVGLDLRGAEVERDGNSNGVAEPGETLELVPTLRSRYKGAADVELTLSSDSDYVNIVSDTVEFPYLESWDEAAADSGWELQIAQDAPFGEQIEFAVRISAADKSYDEIETLVLGVGAFQVLFVDDDAGQGLEVYLNAALAASGYTYAVWDVAGIEAGPNRAALGAYPVVLWNTADQSTDTLDADDRDALADYLDQGGSLLLIGQGILNDIGAEAFASDRLHAASFTLDRGATLLFAPEGESITEGMYFPSLIHVYADGSDAIVPGTNANALLLNQEGGAVALKYPLSGETDYRMIFFSFPFEALPIEGTEPSTGPTLLARCLDWLLPLQIQATDPADGEADVPIDAVIKVRFTKPVDQASLELMLIPEAGELTLSWSDDGTELSIEHSEPFPGDGTEVSVQVVKATDLLGNPLARGDAANPFKFLTAGPPLAEQVVPDHGAPDEPTTVLIKGSGFLETPELTLGGAPLEQVRFRSNVVLTAQVPAGLEEGVYDLNVVNPDGQQSVLEQAFTVGQPEDDDGDDDDACGCTVAPDDGFSGLPVVLLLVTLFGLGRCWGRESRKENRAMSARRNMRTWRATIIILALCVGLLSAATASAEPEWIELDGSAPAGSAPKVVTLRSDSSAVTLDLSIPGFWIEEVLAEGMIYDQISVPGGGTTEEIGLPELPVFHFTVAIPAQARASASIRPGRSVLLDDVLALPFQTPATDGELLNFEIDAAYYDGGAPYPEPGLSIGRPAQWRDLRVVQLTWRPFVYDPISRVLEVTTSARATVKFSGASAGGNAPIGPLYVNPLFEPSYASGVANFARLDTNSSRRAIDADAVNYLVIVDPDFAANAKLAELVDEHEAAGLNVSVVTTATTGTTATAIKNYITTLYNSESPAALQYVLFVADVDVIPFYSWDSNPSDYWYSCIAGSDLYAEIGLGRLPAKTNADLDLMIDKILDWIQGTYSGGWQQKSVLAAHNQEYPGKYTACKESIRTGSYVLEPPTFDTVYGGAGGTNQDVIDAIADGRVIVNYRGHGSETDWSSWDKNSASFTITMAHSLVTNGMTPVVYAICCSNMGLSISGETIAEAFMIDSDGAVAYLGATLPSYTVPNHDFDRYLYRATYNKAITAIGLVFNDAQTELINQYGQGSSYMDNVKMFLWLGDPAIDIPVSTLLSPTNLEAEPDGETAIDLTWNDRTSDEDGFQIERRNPGGSWELIETTAASATAFSDDGLSEGTELYYRVRAYKGDEFSMYSNSAHTATLPAAPSGLFAQTLAGGQIFLSWTDNSGGEQGFVIERSAAGQDFSELAVLGQNVTSYTDSGMGECETYTYRVHAYNIGGVSADAGPVSATTLPNPASGLTAETLSSSAIELAWQDNSAGETGYRVLSKPAGATDYEQLAELGADVTEYSATGLDEATTYSFKVSAVGLGGDSPASNDATATTFPNAPDGLSAQGISETSVALSWTDNSDGEAGYRVERLIAKDEYAAVGVVGQDETEFTDDSLSEATLATYRVRAFTDVNDSEPSNEAQAASLPAAPSELIAVPASEDGIELTWFDNSGGEQGYLIERGVVGDDKGFAEVARVDADAVFFSDEGLDPGTTYVYRVAAFVAEDYSEYSNEAEATTEGDQPGDDDDDDDAACGCGL